jgi:hypothetical protein
MKRILAPMAMLAVLLGPAASPAHETWLVPQHYTVLDGRELQLRLGSGMAFPSFESAIRPERIARSWRRLGGRDDALWVGDVHGTALEFTTGLPVPGVAALAVALQPHPIDLTDDLVTEYFAEIAAPAAVRAAWENRPPGTPWHEVYTKYAKTLVRANRTTHDNSWAEPLGLGLELVPDRDPFRLCAGDTVSFRLLQAGEPLAQWPVGLMAAGDLTRTMHTTDGSGRATFTLTRAGALLVYAVFLQQEPGTFTWKSDFTTLTLEAQQFGDRVSNLEPGTEIRWRAPEDTQWQRAYLVDTTRDALLITRDSEAPADSVSRAEISRFEARLPQPMRADRVLGWAMIGSVAGAALIPLLASLDEGGEMSGMGAGMAVISGFAAGFVLGGAFGALPRVDWQPIDLRGAPSVSERAQPPLGFSLRWMWGDGHS